MDFRQARSQDRNLILTALCAMAVAGGACTASSRNSADGSGEAGRTASTGGTSGGNGQVDVPADDSGSSTGGSGGGASGEVSGSEVDAAAGGGGGGQGGSTLGAGGVIDLPPLTCKEDLDCPSGRNCRAGACVNPRACGDSLECGSSDLVCDASRGFCVQCVRAGDCPSGQSCLSNRCASPVRCQGGADAGAGDCGPGKVCDPSGSCVECSTQADCSPTERCMQNACQTACASDKDCTPKGMLCNPVLGVCTQCSAQRLCASGSYCGRSGVCEFAVCLPGESRCSGNGIASCKADGAGFGTVNVCSAAQTCRVYGGVAACGEVPDAVDAAVASDDGGASASDSGRPPVSSGPRTCGVPTTAAPCTSLPNLIVTQTLDGKGDELCEIPAFHLNADTANAAGQIIAYNATPPEDATVKVAWSSAGLAVFVQVVDPSVQTVNAVAPAQAIEKVHQGDSIELFLASSNDVKGWPGYDSNALHVTIPADGPAVLIKAASSGTTHSAWPVSQYKQVKTATGYVVEAQLPWPDRAPNTGSLVRFDIGLNSADKTFGTVDDMRDGQLLFYVGQVPTSTCQSGDGAVPACDDRTWCTTLLQ
jgi:hypothetical protein